jgi:murein DD-endopeptidase MepM/ murein hydrolase activator NlpD
MFSGKVVVPLVALAGLIGSTAATAVDEPQASAARAATAKATAFARDDGEGTPSGFVTISGDGSRSTRKGTSVSGSTAGYKGRASASADVEELSLLGGAITADVVSVRASASGGSSAVSGRIKNLTIDGADQGSPRSRSSYPVEGYGRLIVLDDSGSGIVGMKIRLTRAHGPYAAGTRLRVGYAVASASDGSPPPPPKPRRPDRPDKPDEPDEPKADRPDADDDSDGDKPKAKAKRRKPPRTQALLTERGYVFPVYGKHRYSNDWGAPRQHTGQHQGTDIFAAAGTPVVAVCDGTLHRLGTNDVPGNRVYLKCTREDEFFYAHLAAFASDARSGLEVKAGKVIGFVGSTGDAEQTPPHLHFEVHPGNGDPVNPYPFLRAWESRRDVPAAAWVRENGSAGAQPGSLVVVKDFLSR